LWLRRWRPSDLEAFAALTADPEVAEHLPSTLSSKESEAMFGRIEEHFKKHGYGLWAVELPGQSPFIGFIGLAEVSFETSFTPCVEIGWRLARSWWGRGLATEGHRRHSPMGSNIWACPKSFPSRCRATRVPAA
jgi:RimJ/RimL family protein N-acetyltransferase